MRSSEDAIRSLKRYVATIVGEEWEVRLPDEAETFTRPFARVMPAGPLNPLPGSQWIANVSRPFVVLLYPKLGDTAEETGLAAMRVEDAVFRGFRAGVAEGRPLRVPMYDYEGVPTVEGSVARHRSDFMRVTDLSVEARQAPDDPNLWVVVTEIRLEWARTAAVVSGGKVVESVGYSPARP